MPKKNKKMQGLSVLIPVDTEVSNFDGTLPFLSRFFPSVALAGKWAEQILLLFLRTKSSLLSFKKFTQASNVNLSLGNK